MILFVSAICLPKIFRSGSGFCEGEAARSEKTKNGEIYLTHTEVPSALEGKGVGSSLVRLALEDIERQQLRLVPLCPFVAGYVQKHPEWKRLVMEGVNIA